MSSFALARRSHFRGSYGTLVNLSYEKVPFNPGTWCALGGVARWLYYEHRSALNWIFCWSWRRGHGAGRTSLPPDVRTIDGSEAEVRLCLPAGPRCTDSSREARHQSFVTTSMRRATRSGRAAEADRKLLWCALLDCGICPRTGCIARASHAGICVGDATRRQEPGLNEIRLEGIASSGSNVALSAGNLGNGSSGALISGAGQCRGCVEEKAGE